MESNHLVTAERQAGRRRKLLTMLFVMKKI